MTTRASGLNDNQASSVRRDMVWMLAGTALRGLSQWGILFLLVKLTSPEVVGQYGLALTLALPVMLFSTLSLTQLQGSDANRSFALGDYGALRLTSTVVALIAIAVIVAVSNPGTTVLILTFAVACQLGVLNQIESFHGLFLQHGRLDKLGQGMIYSNLAIFAVVASALLLDLDVSKALVLSTLALIIPVVLHHLPAGRKIVRGRAELAVSMHPKWRASSQFGLLRIAFPLGISLLVISLSTTMPRYFLVADKGQFELGVLVALLSLLSAGTLFSEALVQTALPRLTKLYAAGNRSGLTATIRRLILGAFGLGLVVVFAAWVAGPTVVALLLAPEYATYRLAIVGIACVFIIELVTRIVALVVTIARVIDPILIVNVVVLGLAVFVSWLLVPVYGVDGAVAALAITALARLAFFAMLCLRTLGWPGSRSLESTIDT